MIKNNAKIKAIVKKAKELTAMIYNYNATAGAERINHVGITPIYDCDELYKGINFSVEQIEPEEVEAISTLEDMDCQLESVYVCDVEFWARREKGK